MADQVIRAKDDSENIYDLAEQRDSDGSWSVAVNDKDVQSLLEEVKTKLDNLQTELEEKLEAGEEVALDAATLAALESITVTVSNVIGVTGTQTDALTDDELRASDVQVNDDSLQALVSSTNAALGDTVTVNTVRELLLRIYSAVDDLELSVDNIDLNTDELESLITELNIDVGEIADASAPTGDGSTIALLKAVRDKLTELDGSFDSTDFATQTTLDSLKTEVKSEFDETQAVISTGHSSIQSSITGADANRSSEASSLLDKVTELDNVVDAFKIEQKTEIDDVQVLLNQLLSQEQNVISTVNSSTTALTGDGVFIGGADDLTNCRQVNVFIYSDVDSATDGIIPEYSIDGTNWHSDVVPPFTYSAGGVRRFQFGVYARYFRLNYTNGSSGQSTFEVQTILSPYQGLESIHRLGNVENADRSVILTKSGVMAETPKGLFESIRATSDRSLLITEKGGNISPSGSKYSEGFIDFITHDFGTGSVEREINKLVDIGTSGAGSQVSGDTHHGGALFITDSAPGSVAFYGSQHFIDYAKNTGHGALGEQTFLLDPTSDPITGDAFVEFGLISPDGESRYCYGYDVNGFYTRLVSHETDEIHDDKEYQSVWSVDSCDGSASSQFVRVDGDGNRVPEAISFTNGNLFRMQAEFLYFAEQSFFVKSPSGEIIGTHVHQFGNDHTHLSVRDANMRLFVEVNNGTAGGSIKVRSGSWHGGVFANKSVSIGRSPSGQLHDVPLGGVDPNNTFIIPSLAADDSYNGEVTDMIGVNSALMFVFSDTNLDTVQWHWYEDETTPSTDPFLSTTAFDETQTGGFYVYASLLTTMIDDFGRIEIVNGPDAAAYVQGYVWLYPQGFSGSFQSPLDPFSALSFALANVSSLQAPDDTDTFLPIGRDGFAGYGSLNVYDTHLPLNEDEDAVDVDVQELPEVEDRPLNKFDTGQLSISTASASQIPTPAAWTPHTLSISNMSGGETGVPIFWGNGLVTAASGGYIQAGGTKEFVYNPNDPDSSGPVYVIAGAEGGAASEDIVVGTSYQVTGATNPENILALDDLYVRFDATDEVISVSGFQSSGLTYDEISTVQLAMEANKEGGTGTETIAYIDGYTAIDSGGTSVTSPTVPADSSYLYIVSISRRAIDADVINIINTLGFSGYELIASVSDGDESFTDVYRMTGTPTSSGTFTVNFDAVDDYAVLSITRYSNVLLSDPIENIDTDFSTSSATASFSMNATQNGMAIVVLGSEIITHTSTVGYTEQIDTGSTANNNQSQAVITKPIITTGIESGTSNMSGIGNITMVGITLTPRPIPDPEITLSYDIGGTPGATSGANSISSTSDTEYTVDVSGDREWTDLDIDDLTITAHGTAISSIYADIDAVYLIVSTSSGTVRVSYEWVGKSNA
jgi:hypothetical protein